MSEKVLFKFQTEETEDGYSLIIERDKQALSDWCPFVQSRFIQSLKKNVTTCMHACRRYSKRRMRSGLNFYERMYKELYGPLEEGQE